MKYQRSQWCDGDCEHRRALHTKSWELRQTILNLAYEVDKVHLGSSFSSAELMTVLYYHELARTDREFSDYLITSARSVLTYAILADLGFIVSEELQTLGRWGTSLDYERVPGLIHMPFGPLGHSLSFACGVAQGFKVKRREVNVYCVLGDGELNEGAIWEAVLTAGHRKLDNLIAVVDRNSFQLSGATEEVKELGAIETKFECFGWTAYGADGHTIGSLVQAFAAARRGPPTPKVIVARTVKGFGVSFMENQPSYHSTAIGEAEYRSARQELFRRAQDGADAG